MNQQQETTGISTLGLIIWSVAAFFFLYEFFLRTFVGSVAHQVIPDLHLNAESFGIIGSVYYIAYGLMQVPVGILIDKFGLKSIMLFATVTCVAGTWLFSASEGFYSALLSRLLMGIGSSFAFVCLLTTVVTWLPKTRFGFFAGVSQFIGTMGPLLAGGPLIAFIHQEHESWRMVLNQIGLLGVGIVLAVLFFVREKPRDANSGVITLNHRISFRQNTLSLLKNKQAWFIALYTASSYVGMELLGAIWGTEYLQARGFSQAISADIISIAWFGYAIGCPLLGALSDMSKRRKPTLMACAVLGFAATSLLLYSSLSNNAWFCAVLFCLIGIAASGQNIGFAAIAEHTAPEIRATTMGFNNGCTVFFSASLPFLISALIRSDDLVNSFTLAFSVLPLLYLIAMVVSTCFVHETYCKPQKETILLQREVPAA